MVKPDPNKRLIKMRLTIDGLVRLTLWVKLRVNGLYGDLQQGGGHDTF